MTAEDFKVIRPKAINVNSEMSSASERAYLAKKFNSFVFDDYSSEELTRIASQCESLNYHLFDDLNYIEIVDDAGRPLPEGQVGQIVGTNLHNIGMPLLRYNQGDRGAVRTKKCACGRNFRILEKLEGRKNDAFIISSGETFSSGYLLDLTYGVFLDYPDAVRSFCLLQVEPNLWLLELVPGTKWRNGLDMEIVQKLRQQINNNTVQLLSAIVPEVRRTASGKANPIISLVKK
jgi:phenylacetate-CoA ligase